MRPPPDEGDKRRYSYPVKLNIKQIGQNRIYVKDNLIYICSQRKLLQTENDSEWSLIKRVLIHLNRKLWLTIVNVFNAIFTYKFHLLTLIKINYNIINREKQKLEHFK